MIDVVAVNEHPGRVLAHFVEFFDILFFQDQLFAPLLETKDLSFKLLGIFFLLFEVRKYIFLEFIKRRFVFSYEPFYFSKFNIKLAILINKDVRFFLFFLFFLQGGHSINETPIGGS